MAAPVTQVAPPAPGAGTRGVTIVPSNTVPLTNPISGLYVGGAGDINLVMSNDLLANPVLLKAVPVGTYLNLSVAYILATGTTATLLVGFR